MAGIQAHKRPISQPTEGTSATRLRNNRSNTQTTIVTTTSNYSQSQQYGNQIGCSTGSSNVNGNGNGNGTTSTPHTIGISTITTSSNQILQPHQHDQPQHQHVQHVEIILSDDNDDAEQIAAERELEHSGRRVRHRHHKRPFYRRVFNYIRTAWTGVHFTSSNGKNHKTTIFLSRNLDFYVIGTF